MVERTHSIPNEDLDIRSLTNTVTCRVRPAQPTDGNAMAALAEQLGYPCTGAEVRRRLDAMKDLTQYGAFVAVHPPGEIVGWIGTRVFRAVELAPFAEISGLVVEATLRSRGIGKALLKAAEDWARRVGLPVISVNSNLARERAHQFYIRNGYELVKTQRIFRKSFGHGENPKARSTSVR